MVTLPVRPAASTAATAPSAIVSLPAMMPDDVRVRAAAGSRRPRRPRPGSSSPSASRLTRFGCCEMTLAYASERTPAFVSGLLAGELDVVSAVRQRRDERLRDQRPRPARCSRRSATCAIPVALISRSTRKTGTPASVAFWIGSDRASAPALSRMIAFAPLLDRGVDQLALLVRVVVVRRDRGLVARGASASAWAASASALKNGLSGDGVMTAMRPPPSASPLAVVPDGAWQPVESARTTRDAAASCRDDLAM